MTAASNPKDLPEQSLREVLINTSLFLDGLLATVKKMEDLLLLNLAQTDSPHSRAFNIQSVDFVTQSLEEMVHLLERIGADLPGSMAINQDRVISPIKLKALKDQILTAQSRGADHYNDRLAADVELF